MNFETIQVRVEQSVCYLTLNRPHANNCINRTLVAECQQALKTYEDTVHIVVLEGLPEVFCLGADFRDYTNTAPGDDTVDPEALYDLWTHLAEGPFVSIAHVRGKANAGGVGFVAACDIVLADTAAEFSLPELLFALVPVCVMPFLVKRIGIQKAHYLTLMTKSVNTNQALDWGLIDACDANSSDLLRKHLLRLRHLTKPGIRRHKAYMNSLNTILADSRSGAIAANRELFADPENLETIRRYADTGLFPWED